MASETKNGTRTEMYVQLMDVTPEMAQRWLDTSNTWNRDDNENNISKLAHDMEMGQFLLTHQGIAFDTDNIVLDGQNRLYAIVRSGKTVKLWVWFNVPREAMKVCDTGGVRRLRDSALFHAEVAIEKKHSATAAAMLDPKMNCKISRQDAIAFLMKHYGSIDWSCALFTHHISYVTTAQLRAIVARAFYNEDHDRIRQFAEVMQTGMASGAADKSAILARSKLMGGGNDGATGRRAAYFMMEWALQKFLERDSTVKRVSYADRELFPLPEEIQALKRRNGKPVHKLKTPELATV